VLVIDQFELASPASAAILSSFRSTLRANTGPPISHYIENLDLGRFGGPQFRAAVQGYFQEKYRDRPIGVVVPIGSGALELALHLRTQLWVDAPVIFAAVDEGAPHRLKLPSKVTGTTTPAPLSDAVAVARAVVPGLRRIAVVGDPPERQVIRAGLSAQLDLIAAEFELINLTGLRLAEVKQRIATLPSDSAILYLGLTLDGDNIAYTSYEALAALAGAANRPIIVQAETNIGTGAVGGVVASFTLVGEETARLVIRVLAGEDPAMIPVAAGKAMKAIFDWRQLQRWKISEDRLPAGSEVRFRQPSIWDQYKWYVVSAVTLCSLQAVLILVLLSQGRRLRRAHSERRRAEDAAHSLSGRLISAHEEERSRLARELHDDVTQRLALLAIDAGREERNPANAAGVGTMRAMREGLVRLSEDVHALSYRLHPSILEDLGLVEALKSECERSSRNCPVRLELDAADVPRSLPHGTALCLFRIAQEGLRNIARHAKATRAEVSLRKVRDGLQLTVKDDGKGFDPAHHRMRSSLGLASMRQRAFLVDGKVEIDSNPGYGTVITAWVPLQREHNEPSARATG
jgi:signal transduction histidine kinase